MDFCILSSNPYNFCIDALCEYIDHIGLKSEHPFREINDFSVNRHSTSSWSPLYFDLSCSANDDIIDSYHVGSAPLVDGTARVELLYETLVEGDVPEQVIIGDSQLHVQEPEHVSSKVTSPSCSNSEEVTVIEYYKPPSYSLCNLFVLPISFSFSSYRCSFCFCFSCLCVAPHL